ncbi:MAG: hypothetical protein GY927_07180 [bacterium]|nr:hypothetical protein [bacterium]
MRSTTNIILGLIAVAGLIGTAWFSSEYSSAMQQVKSISAKAEDTNKQSASNLSLLETAKRKVSTLQVALDKEKAENATTEKALMTSKTQLKAAQANNLAAIKKSSDELSVAKAALQNAKATVAANTKSLAETKSTLKMEKSISEGLTKKLKAAETQLQSAQKTIGLEKEARKHAETALAKIKALEGN